MPGKIIITKDGSPSVELREGVTYHSTFGAIQESRHVFVGEGWKAIVGSGVKGADGEVRSMDAEMTDMETVHVFELGFGTGLNALLTFIEAEAIGRPVLYETVEVAPLDASIFESLSYCELLGRPDLQEVFLQMHRCDWDSSVQISPRFTFYKSRDAWPDHVLQQPANVVYYDAFDPMTQPELWEERVFRRLAEQLTPGALLVTYCSKGVVRRALQAAGFCVEKRPGPPGKREIVRARLATVKNGSPA